MRFSEGNTRGPSVTAKLFDEDYVENPAMVKSNDCAVEPALYQVFSNSSLAQRPKQLNHLSFGVIDTRNRLPVSGNLLTLDGSDPLIRVEIDL